MIVTAFTVGGVAVVPSTLWSDAVPMAWLLRSRTAAVPAALRMAPPLSASALAPTAMPSVSASALTTAYSKVSDAVSLPEA